MTLINYLYPRTMTEVNMSATVGVNVRDSGGMSATMGEMSATVGKLNMVKEI